MITILRPAAAAFGVQTREFHSVTAPRGRYCFWQPKRTSNTTRDITTPWDRIAPARIWALALLLVTTVGRLPGQDKELQALADNFADMLVKASKKSAAVVDFTDLQGNVTELGRYLAEQISVALVVTGRGLEIVDRTHLRALLQEHKLGTAGIIDPATAVANSQRKNS